MKEQGPSLACNRERSHRAGGHRPDARSEAMKALLVSIDRPAIAATVEYLLYLGGVILAIALMTSGGH
jgi:hypothetical protein